MHLAQPKYSWLLLLLYYAVFEPKATATHCLRLTSGLAGEEKCCHGTLKKMS